MTIQISLPASDVQTRPRITVFGVGGAGGNAVNNMIRANLEGVEFVVANTDAQALSGSLASKRVQLGATITRGLGAGSRPDVGKAAAEEQLEEILGHLGGTNMCFITAGMGGGTGTGAAPVIARLAREQGILTVGVVTKPFHFEGAHRMRVADAGIAELAGFVDTLLIIPNQNLFRIANERTTFADAFKMADDVLHAGVRGVTDLMVMPGLINLDFADIRTVMSEMGKAMMGTGEATGDRRAVEAAEAAISNPLLDDVSMKGARGVLINITGGYDMTLFEVDEAANRIRDEVDPEANIIFGSTFDPEMDGRMRVSVVATGIEAAASQHLRPGQFQVGGQPQLTVVHDRGARKGAAVTGGGGGGAGAAAPVAAVGRPAVAAGVAATYATLTPAPLPVNADVPATGEATATDALIEDRIAAAIPPEPRRADTPPPVKGERREGGFIPPRPADGGPRAGLAGERVGSTPFVPPGKQSAPPARKPGLFQRVFGIGGDSAEPAATGKGMGMTEPALGNGRSAPANPLLAAQQPPFVAAPARTQQPASGPATAQSAPLAPSLAAPSVEGQTRTGRLPAPAEEDVLDIPAFLRRQAN